MDTGFVRDIAEAVVKASPVGEPGSVKERDEAATRLGQLDALQAKSEFHVLWSRYEASRGIDLEKNKFLQLNPLVFAKAYLSLFMFTGKYDVRTEDDAVVVELDARFRSGLPASEYPQVLWPTPEAWNAYANTGSVLLVFSEGLLGAAFYKPAGAAPAKPVPAPGGEKWDGRWNWTDDRGARLPRAAQYAFLFSSDNPHAAPLDKAYRAFEGALETHNCVSCHSPDNKSDAAVLVLLRSPNQALAARHALAAVLREEAMPPGDLRRGVMPGIHNEDERVRFIRMADEFDHQAEAALTFEQDKRRPKSETNEKPAKAEK